MADMAGPAGHVGDEESERARSESFLVGIGATTVVLGILALAVPFVASLTVTASIGALLVVSGVARCIFAFRRGARASLAVMVVMGALSVLAGLVMLALPLLALESLTLLLAAYFAVYGVFQIAWCLRAARDRERSWAWAVVDGVAALVLAAIVWAQWPVSGLWTVGLVVGVQLVFTGSALIALGRARRDMRTHVGRVRPVA